MSAVLFCSVLLAFLLWKQLEHVERPSGEANGDPSQAASLLLASISVSIKWNELIISTRQSYYQEICNDDLKTALRRAFVVLVRLNFLTWVVGTQMCSVYRSLIPQQSLPSPCSPNTSKTCLFLFKFLHLVPENIIGCPRCTAQLSLIRF